MRRVVSPLELESQLESRLEATRWKSGSVKRHRQRHGIFKVATVVRKPAMLVVGLIGAMVLSLSAFATNYTIDLTTAGSSGTVNGGIFVQGGVGAGTGTFDPFLTVSPGGSTPQEAGVNSCVDNPNAVGCKGNTYDTFYGGGRTHAIQVAGIPSIHYPDANDPNDPLYREFSLDANDQGADDFMSIDEVKIFIDDQANLHEFDGLNTFADDTGTAALNVWDTDATGVLMRSQSLTPGSGVSDITLLVPNDRFPDTCFYGSTICNKWLYFWTHMGGAGVIGGHDYNVTAGFEEWRVRLAPVVNIDKTVVTSYTNTYTWDIDKSVTPETAKIFTGDTQDAEWTVSWTRNAPTQSNITVSGVISITNPTGGAVIPTAIPATITALPTDVLTNGGAATVSGCKVGNTNITTFPYTLAAGATLTCNYSKTVSTTADDTNTASVTINNGSGGTATFTSVKTVSFASATVTNVDASATVTDLTGPLNMTVNATGSTSYTKTYGCGVVNNTATLTPSNSGVPQTADASTTISCYDLAVSKTATPTWDRTFDWTVDKSVDPTSLEIDPGSSGVLNYTITATRTEVSNTFGVSGTITITNNNPDKSAIVTALSDVADGVSGTINSVDCTFPLTIPASNHVNCGYTVTGLPDANGTNTATATNQNRHWSKSGTSLGNIGTTNYSGHQDYLLSAPSGLTDETATVNDPGITCPAGFTCVPDYTLSGSPPWTFTDSGSVTFSVTVTADAAVPCNTFFNVPNVVTLTENDSGTTHLADALAVIWTGPCPSLGCTPGFWQGGLGVTLWNTVHDLDWQSHGGASTWNPFVTTDTFISFFGSSGSSTVDNMTMLQIVGSGGTSFWPEKAARDLIAAYLNASFFGSDYPYSTATILSDWNAAVAQYIATGSTAGFETFHAKYSVANELGCTVT
jgi:hypothetical protein